MGRRTSGNVVTPLHSGLYLHFKSLKKFFCLVGKAWCRQQKPLTIEKFSDGISFYLATIWLVGTYGTTLSANQRIITTEPIRWFHAFSRAWQHLTAACWFFLQVYPFIGLCWPSVWLAGFLGTNQYLPFFSSFAPVLKEESRHAPRTYISIIINLGTRLSKTHSYSGRK